PPARSALSSAPKPRGREWAMDRREFLSLGSVAALLPVVPANAASTQTGGTAGDGQLNAAFDKIFEEQVRAFPTFATNLGLDKGANAEIGRAHAATPV